MLDEGMALIERLPQEEDDIFLISMFRYVVYLHV